MSHGLEHLGSCDHGLTGSVGFTHDIFLNNSHAGYRSFYTEVAAGDHNAISNFEDRIQVIQGITAFNFGDNKWLVIQSFTSLPDMFNIGCTGHKALADCIQVLFGCKLQAFMVSFGKCTHTKFDTRKV